MMQELGGKIRESSRVIIGESQFQEFYESALEAGNREIVGALVGLRIHDEILLLSIFNYKERCLSATRLKYNQIDDMFFPAGIEVVGTIHSHPGFGAFLSLTDLKNLQKLNLNKIALVLDPRSCELRAFNKRGEEVRISVVEDYELWSKIKTSIFYKHGIPFRVYIPRTLDFESKIILKRQIDLRYGNNHISGIKDLIFDEKIVYYKRPRVISLKYKNKIPLYFPIFAPITYKEWFEKVILNGIIDFKFEYLAVLRNGKKIDFEFLGEEVVRDGLTEFLIF